MKTELIAGNNIKTSKLLLLESLKCFFAVLCLGLMFNGTAHTQDNPNGKTKLYTQMSTDEKISFVSTKSDEILAGFGRTAGDEISQQGLDRIKISLDSYVKRLSSPKLDSCAAQSWLKSDLGSVLKRGSRNAAAIREEFTAQGLAPQFGIYVAMVESEFCPCMQSPVGTLGMFAMTSNTAKSSGINAVKGATTAKPDERCQPQFAARGAAIHTKKDLVSIFGMDAVGYTLALDAYNRGESMTKRHIAETATVTTASRISSWVLLDNYAKLVEKNNKENPEEKKPAKSDDSDDSDESTQTSDYLKMYQSETIKYVPKFFAAAIIGENPQYFGLNMPPLSEAK